MRVLHLSTASSGGAAIAGLRLHSAMRSIGIDSQFASRGPALGVDGEHVIAMSRLDALRSSATTVLSGLSAQQPLSAFTPYSSDFVDHAWVRDVAPDVVIVHNWFNLLGTSAAGMLAELDVPVCFLLHDERLFTGGCHYAGECRRFEHACSHCPQARAIARPVVWREQQAMRARLQGAAVSVVAPSRWLADEAAASAVLRGFPIAHIPNTIDTAVFHPGLRAEARAHFSIPDDAQVIAWQPGKGDELFAPVMRQLQESLQGQLAVLHTGASVPSVDIRAIAAGRLATEAERARFWAAADVALSLTPFDNFPNISLEAMACGVPFITADVGGAGESVRATGGGVAVARDGSAIAAALLDVLRDPLLHARLSAAGVEGVMREYAPAVIAGRYRDLLSKIV